MTAPPLATPDLRVKMFDTPNTVDGGPHAEVFLPSGELPKEGAPIALFIHGGAWIVGGASGLARRTHHVTWLSTAGLISVSAEYRLAPHADMDIIAEDVRSSYAWVTGGGLQAALHAAGSSVKVDTSRIGIWGPSAGGWAVTYLGAVANPPVKAVLAYYAPLDWAHLNPRDAGAEEPAADHPVRRAIARVLEGPAVTDTKFDLPGGEARTEGEIARRELMAEGYRSRTVGYIASNRLPSNDPFSLVTSSHPPILLMHGDADPVVPISCSRRYFDKLQGLGVESELVEVRGAGHGWVIEEGGEGELGERWEVDRSAIAWLVEKVKA